MKWIASYSAGKDSTAMLHVIRERGLQLDGVLWVDTGWEWPAVVEHTRKVQVNLGITITVLRPAVPWNDLLARWGWPHWNRRWCTGEKGRILDTMRGDHGRYIGLAADEQQRIDSYARRRKCEGGPTVRFPLAEAGITTAEALAMCRRLGYDWGGLYDMGTRVSCFCCPFQSATTLRAMRRDRPDMFQRLCEMHDALPESVRAQGWKKGRTPEQVADGDRIAMRGRYGEVKRRENADYWTKVRSDPARLEAKRRKDREAKWRKRHA